MAFIYQYCVAQLLHEINADSIFSVAVLPNLKSILGEKCRWGEHSFNIIQDWLRVFEICVLEFFFVVSLYSLADCSGFNFKKMPYLYKVQTN